MENVPAVTVAPVVGIGALDQQFMSHVNVLVKSGELILAELTPAKVDLWHAGTGVSGEAGELLDAIKKVVAYNKPLDRENVVEELGDLEFYMQQVRLNLGISREETLLHNIAKLRKRYPAGYSDLAAMERADKTIVEVGRLPTESTVVDGPDEE